MIDLTNPLFHTIMAIALIIPLWFNARQLIRETINEPWYHKRVLTIHHLSLMLGMLVCGALFVALFITVLPYEFITMLTVIPVVTGAVLAAVRVIDAIWRLSEAWLVHYMSVAVGVLVPYLLLVGGSSIYDHFFTL